MLFISFASKFTQELCKILGIQQNISTVYHPRTDGQSERTNQWLEQYLHFWVNERQDNWSAYLPLAEFTHNNWPNETTRESPFFLLMGYNPRADWTDRPSPIPQVALRLDQFKEARKHAQELMTKAQKSWVKNKDTPKFKIGDQVWLEGRHLCTNQPTTKLAPRRHSPFPVVQMMSPVNYRLELPTQWSIHPVFHIDLLTPYRETPTHGPNYQRPLPELIDGAEEYELEKILDSQKFGRGCKLQYLVKWKGYPDSENQWVDKDDVFADEALRRFKRLNPASQTHIRSVCTPYILTIPSTAKSMSSTTNDTLNDVVLPTYTTDVPQNSGHQEFCQALTAFLGPVPGRVSPEFLEEQRDGSTEDEEDADVVLLVEGRPNRQGTPAPQLLVHIPSTSDISDVLCCHATEYNYCHRTHADRVPKEGPNPVFVRPPGTPRHPLGSLDGVSPTCTQGEKPVHGDVVDPAGHIRRYDVNSDKENSQNATQVSFACQDAEGLGHGGGRGQRSGKGMGEAEAGPIRLYHPWETHSVSVQVAPRPKSPVPFGFEMNHGPQYVPFHIVNRDGVTVPAKYVKVKMTNDPYTYGMLNSTGEVYKGLIHAAPILDITNVPRLGADDLVSLCFDYADALCIDNALARVGDKSLCAEVHRFHHIKKQFAELDPQMKTLESEMWALQTRQRQCVGRLEKADVLRHIDHEHGQDIRIVPSWAWEEEDDK